MLSILHITESYGGGVTSAINTYVNHSLKYQHHLCAFRRESDATGEEGRGNFTSVLFAPRSLAGFFLIWKQVNELNPDVIHIHSTYAGVFFRLLPCVRTKKVVYTPHGFAFLRSDGAVKTTFYRLVEKMFVGVTDVLAGCSRAEVIEARRLGYARVQELVNVCEEIPRYDGSAQNLLPTIGMVGRVCEQKGYDYFAQVAAMMRGKAHFKWIGGGDEGPKSLLISCGVEVTGWLSRKDVIIHVGSLDLYFHTAAWEGFPISVLEAAKLAKPIVLRSIPSFTVENLPVVTDAYSAVDELSAWLNSDTEVLRRARSTSEAIERYHSSENLTRSLVKLYEGGGDGVMTQ